MTDTVTFSRRTTLILAAALSTAFAIPAAADMDFAGKTVNG